MAVEPQWIVYGTFGTMTGPVEIARAVVDGKTVEVADREAAKRYAEQHPEKLVTPATAPMCGIMYCMPDGKTFYCNNQWPYPHDDAVGNYAPPA